jgi:hypothetical protein
MISKLRIGEGSQVGSASHSSLPKGNALQTGNHSSPAVMCKRNIDGCAQVFHLYRLTTLACSSMADLQAHKALPLPWRDARQRFRSLSI